MGVKPGLYRSDKRMSRLQVTEMRYLRRVEGVTKLDKVRKEDIRQRLKQEAVVEVARKKQRAWKEKLNGIGRGKTCEACVQ